MYKRGDKIKVICGPSFLMGLTGVVDSIIEYSSIPAAPPHAPILYYIIPDDDEWTIACRYIGLKECDLERIDNKPLPLPG